MKYTNNYNLKKPEGMDKIDIDDFNYNADVIDQLLKPSINDGKAPASNSEKLVDTLSGIANRIKTITGNISWTDEPVLNLKQVKEASNSLITLLEDVKNHSDQLESPKYSNIITTKAAVTKIDTDTRKQLKITGIKGKTVVNLLGKAGDCNDITQYSSGFNARLSIVDGLKVVNNGDSNGANLVGTAWKNISEIAQLGKYYCLSGQSKVIDADSCIINMYEQNTTNQCINSKFNTSKTYTYWYGKMQRKDINKALILELGVIGGKDKSAVFKNLMIIEITEADYNDPNYQPPLYVNGEASVKNAEFKCVGKNLINLVQGSYYVNANSPNQPNGVYVFTTTRITHNNAKIYVKPNTNYRITINSNLNYRYSEFDINSNTVFDSNWSSIATNTINILTKNDTNFLCMAFKINDVTNIYPQNYQIQLEEGTTATTYEPYKETEAKIPYLLRALSDTVYDEVDKNGILNKRIEKVVLDESLDWVFNDSSTDFKRVRVDNLKWDIIDHFHASVFKYNNKQLKIGGIASAGEGFTIEFLAGKQIFITIPNVESGWGDSYAPTADEIKAYFMGHRMAQNITGFPPYNGTGEKVWYMMMKNSAPLPVFPTSTYAEWTPYLLYYQLQTPQQIDLNLPNLVVEPNGSFVISSDYGIIPETQYQLADNLKANVDDLMVQVAKDREFTNNTIAEQPIQWIKPTLLNGWEYLGYNNQPPQYYRDKDGFVHIIGTITGGTKNSKVFTLPIGFRPKFHTSRAIASSVDGINNIILASCIIFNYGDIILRGDGVYFDLGEIVFKAEQ